MGYPETGEKWPKMGRFPPKFIIKVGMTASFFLLLNYLYIYFEIIVSGCRSLELADIMSFPAVAAIEYLRCLVVVLIFYVIKKSFGN